MKDLRNWALGFLGTVAAVVISYHWLDRPIALFVNSRLEFSYSFGRLTLIPEVMTALLVAAFIALAFYALSGQKLSRLQTVLLLCGTNLAVAVAIKDMLKYAFGRPWPETWLHYNESFLSSGAYGFRPFHGGIAFQSFPSGHSTMACTVMTVFWICYPRFRPLYALCMVAVAVGLVGANFHFLSDVIAGSYLGISAGWLGVAIWEMGQRQVQPERDAAATSPRSG
jgi:membrane-associated phospholipid phosphatase